MLDKKPIIRTNHWRPGCVIPVGWVFENWKSKFLISNWQRKRCHRDRGAVLGASAAIGTGGRTLVQALASGEGAGFGSVSAGIGTEGRPFGASAAIRTARQALA